MFFFDSPSLKMNIVAKHLNDQLKEICREEWMAFYKEISKYHNRFLKDEVAVPTNQLLSLSNYIQHTCSDDIMGALPDGQVDELFKSKIYIDVEESSDSEGNTSTRKVNSHFVYWKYKGSIEHYRQLLLCSDIISSEMSKSDPDYTNIFNNVTKIRTSDRMVPSIESGQGISLKLHYLSGGNIVTNLFWGVACTLIRTIQLTISLLCLIPYYLTESEKLSWASPSSIFSVVKEIANILGRVIGSLIFPIGMIYSQYMTGSWNVLKGELTRTVDSLITFSDTQRMLVSPCAIQNSNQLSS